MFKVSNSFCVGEVSKDLDLLDVISEVTDILNKSEYKDSFRVDFHTSSLDNIKARDIHNLHGLNGDMFFHWECISNIDSFVKNVINLLNDETTLNVEFRFERQLNSNLGKHVFLLEVATPSGLVQPVINFSLEVLN